MLLAISLNISDGQQAQLAGYTPADVKSEFGADAGGTMNVQCHSEFGMGYKYCTISAIEKVGVAQAYVCFLFDDLPVIMEALQTDALYHALRFR